MDWKLALQIVGVVLGLLYLWLEYKANIWLWVVGLVMPIVHGTLYFRSGLYADFAMQLYYIAAGIYGLIVWSRGVKRHDRKSELRIASTPSAVWVVVVGVHCSGKRRACGHGISPREKMLWCQSRRHADPSRCCDDCHEKPMPHRPCYDQNQGYAFPFL